MLNIILMGDSISLAFCDSIWVYVFKNIFKGCIMLDKEAKLKLEKFFKAEPNSKVKIKNTEGEEFWVCNKNFDFSSGQENVCITNTCSVCFWLDYPDRTKCHRYDEIGKPASYIKHDKEFWESGIAMKELHRLMGCNGECRGCDEIKKKVNNRKID